MAAKGNSILLKSDNTMQSTGKKTYTTSFRVHQSHIDKLAELPYKNNGGVLVRLLLDLYFNNQIPAAKMRFNKLIEDAKCNTDLR